MEYPKIINNSVIIPNANISNYPIINRDLKNNNITYISSIVPSNNLLLLLQEFSKILGKINAKLIIVGGYRLYSKHGQLGPNNITEPGYEKQLFDTIKANKIEGFVEFVGLKNAYEIASEIAPITKVGIVNPGYNKYFLPETFCLSATQLGSFGIPVIGGNLGGLKYTIPKKCGYRINSSEELSKRILELLKDYKKNVKYGNNNQKYIKKHYDVKLFEQKWINLLNGKSKKNKYITLLPYVIFKIFLKVCLKIINVVKK